MLASEIIRDLKETIVRQRRVILALTVALGCVCVFSVKSCAAAPAQPAGHAEVLQSAYAVVHMDKQCGRRFNLKNEFTEDECDHFRARCNFTPEELAVFNMRVRECSLVEISMQLNMSERTVDRRLASIKKKIVRVL